MRLWIKILLLGVLSVTVVNAERGFREQDSSLKSEEIANLYIGKKYAVIIGINSYKNGINPLKTAVNDAKAVEKILKEVYGFETILIIDSSATKDNILENIENVAKKVKANDQMLVYYGGHGYFEKQTDTSYWIPSDAKSDSFIKGIKSKDISDLLKMSQSKQVLIVSDSCYSGTMDRDNSIQWKSQSDTRASFLQKQLYEKSRVLLSSGGNEPVSDGYGEHSIFAKYFIKKLKEFEKDIFTAEELYISYKEPISGNSSQTPEYKGIMASGHESGDFVFVKKVIKELAQPVQKIEQVVKPVVVQEVVKPVIPKDIVVIDGLWYQNQPFSQQDKNNFDNNKEGGRVWTWEGAKNYCNNLTLAGYDDWSLPTRDTLMKLGNIELYQSYTDDNLIKWIDNNIDKQITNSRGDSYYIKKEFVENMPFLNDKRSYDAFWSITEDNDFDFVARYVSFHLGNDESTTKSSKNYTLCVRR